MACMSLRPRNGAQIGSRKTVTVKVEPSYISSDLFTPFSEPRSTLPSIAEFVRPSYGRERTWGTVTSSYGGVGSACQLFKKKGRGSISRSHRHYGSGCLSYEDELDLHHTREPAYKHESAALGAAPPRQCERITTITNKNVPLSVGTASALKNVCASLYGTSSYNNDFTSTPINSTAPHQNHPHSTPIQREIADSTDILTLHKENIQLLKNEDYRCEKCEFCTEGSHFQKEEGYEDQDALDDDSCSSCDSEEEESCSDNLQYTSSASHITSATHGHMISIPPCSNVLPSHVTVNGLSELPSHFRRVTTKYTRNRCPLFPCRVPHYLLRKHQLLPSIMAVTPPFSGKRSAGQHVQLSALAKDTSTMTAMNYRQNISKSGAPNITEPSAMTIQDQTQLLAVARDRDTAAGIYHDINFDGSGDNTSAPCGNSCLPDLAGSGQEADKNGDAKGGAKSDQNGLRYHRHHHPHKHHHHHHQWSAGKVLSSKAPTQQGPSNIIFMQSEGKGHMRRHSRVVQHLGQRFKTQAHMRYHSQFPEQVPDLQTIEPSKRHTFSGYHTSVFRG